MCLPYLTDRLMKLREIVPPRACEESAKPWTNRSCVFVYYDVKKQSYLQRACKIAGEPRCGHKYEQLYLEVELCHQGRTEFCRGSEEGNLISCLVNMYSGPQRGFIFLLPSPLCLRIVGNRILE